MRGAQLLVSLGLAIGMVAPAGVAASPPASTTAAENLTLPVGYSPPLAVVDRFFPERIRIAEGTTVTWVQDGLRRHTVTFLGGEPLPLQNVPQPEDPALPQMRNPLAEFPTLPNREYDGSYFINSGVMGIGDTFSVTFGRAGTYPFLCIPHAEMVGSVEVVRPGTPGTTTQAEVDQTVRAHVSQYDGWVDEMFSARDVTSRVEGADGKDTWFVRVGSDLRVGDDHLYTLLRAFLPAQLSVQRGDTVVWYTDSRVPVHTVTFPLPGVPFAQYSPQMSDGSLVPLEMLDQKGRYVGPANSLDWPRIVQDPSLGRVARPSPVYEPGRYFNSGQLGDAGPRAWSLTFDTPGTFEYLCIPHVDIGMIGQITVLPRG